MSVYSRLGQHRGQHGEPYRPGVPRKGVWVRSEMGASVDRLGPGP